MFATRALPGAPWERVREIAELRVWDGEREAPREVLLGEAARCEGLIVMLVDRVDAELLRGAPKLRVISTCSVGVDHIDVAAAQARGIRVGNTPGVLTEATADLAFALLLSAARRIPEADRFVRAGGWTQPWEPDLLLGKELAGATLGIVGLGAIGAAVARRAQGFGMRVLAWSRSGRSAPGVSAVRDFAELLAASDFVSVHVARTRETLGLIGARELSRMKRGAILVNSARGGIVDEDALCDALASGQLAAAGLDVYASEPLPADSPLLRAPNLVLAPHIGSATRETRARMAELCVRNLVAGLRGQPGAFLK
ncbi:MAG TPA: D-glycerate dehydrogenase [Myxococcota bacterium]|nr:D-glycerate dehydrogenase [Myxococcota bacterium]